MKAAMSRRMGNSVTVINAICKTLRKREKKRVKETDPTNKCFVIFAQSKFSVCILLLNLKSEARNHKSNIYART